MITNGPMNVTVCSGTKANISCGYTGVTDFVESRPNWRIIKRNNNGSVISNETVSGMDIRSNKFNDLDFFVRISAIDNNADGSYLSVGPVDDTYNNTSYQCIFTINDTIIESDTAGTISVNGRCDFMYVNNTDAFIFPNGLYVKVFNYSLYNALQYPIMQSHNYWNYHW